MSMGQCPWQRSHMPRAKTTTKLGAISRILRRRPRLRRCGVQPATRNVTRRWCACMAAQELSLLNSQYVLWLQPRESDASHFVLTLTTSGHTHWSRSHDFVRAEGVNRLH